MDIDTNAVTDVRMDVDDDLGEVFMDIDEVCEDMSEMMDVE